MLQALTSATHMASCTPVLLGALCVAIGKLDPDLLSDMRTAAMPRYVWAQDPALEAVRASATVRKALRE